MRFLYRFLNWNYHHHLVFKMAVLIYQSLSFYSITKESIIDVYATVVKTATPIESCTVSDVELVATQVWIVSAARAQLPLQIEDAARPEKTDVSSGVLLANFI